MERDLLVPMADGVRLSANVFRPASPGQYPAILSATPYDKNKLPDRTMMLFMRLAGVRFGTLNCSRWAGFEAPDPIYWVGQGYVVAQADVRGMHASEGSAGVLRDQDAADYAAFVAWAAAQSWCNSRVGLLGVSYLAMSQWRVAALRPPALKAICPWEGVTDLLREFAYQDGIPETSFIPTWWKNRMLRGRNPRFPMAEDFPADLARHPFDDDYWAGKRPSLEKIDVPALVCASWSDQGLHTRGSFIGYERISSTHKWLFTHGRRKWETFYGSEAVAVQTAFFAYALKQQPSAMDGVPAVRLERRRAGVPGRCPRRARLARGSGQAHAAVSGSADDDSDSGTAKDSRDCVVRLDSPGWPRKLQLHLRSRHGADRRHAPQAVGQRAGC